MGGTYDRDEPDVIDVELPARARPPARQPVRTGRATQRLRQASLAAAAAVIVVGVVAAGGLLGGSVPTNPPVAAATEAPCRAISPTSGSPAFRLAGGPDDERGVRGLPGERFPELGATDTAWQLPGIEQSLTVATQGDLHLILATGACAVEVEVEVAPAGAGADPAATERQGLVRTTLDPASHAFAFGSPAEGDWVLRIVVRYVSSDATFGEERLAEWFFRVRVGNGPFATPSEGPVVVATPALPCGPAPAVPAEAVVTLSGPGSDPVPGVEPGNELPVVEVDVGATVEVAVVGAACATSWTIDTRAGESITSIEAVVNAGNDPARAAQNVWQFIVPETADEVDLVVVLRFGTAGVVERLWHVRLQPFEIPRLFVVAADGRRVAADPGCGLFLERANGLTIEDTCETRGFEPGERLEVGALEPLSVEIEGWTIVAWTGTCGRMVTTDEGTEEYESSGCGLGGFSMEGFSERPPVRFVAPPGDHVLLIWITATSNGDRYSVPYFARVLAR